MSWGQALHRSTAPRRCWILFSLETTFCVGIPFLYLFVTANITVDPLCLWSSSSTFSPGVWFPWLSIMLQRQNNCYSAAGLQPHILRSKMKNVLCHRVCTSLFWMDIVVHTDANGLKRLNRFFFFFLPVGGIQCFQLGCLKWKYQGREPCACHPGWCLGNKGSSPAACYFGHKVWLISRQRKKKWSLPSGEALAHRKALFVSTRWGITHGAVLGTGVGRKDNCVTR